MSKAVCCDRCGILQKCVYGQMDGWYKLQPEGPTADDPLMERQHEVLICPACHKSFDAWMAGHD